MKTSELLGPEFKSQKELAEKIYPNRINNEDFASIESLKVIINNMLSGKKTMSEKFTNAYKATLKSEGREEDYVEKKVDQFKALIAQRRNAKRNITSARIGVGHFTFSTPIIGEIIESYINQTHATKLKLTSYGSSESEPVYYNVEDDKKSSEKVIYFTANDLKNLINEDKLDIVCTASKVFNQKNDADAIPVCSIAKTIHNGVYPVLFSKKGTYDKKKDLWFNEYIKENAANIYKKNGQRKIPIFYLKETLSENFLKQLESGESQIDFGKIIPIQIYKPTISEITQVIDKTKHVAKIDEENFIFPIWEPAATKIRREAEKIGFSWKYLRTSSDRLVDKKLYFYFDLYVSERFLGRNGAVPFLINFISKIEQRVEKLDEEYYQVSPEGQQILKYFEMDDDFWLKLKEINFDVRYYPRFIDYLSKKYKIE